MRLNLYENGPLAVGFEVLQDFMHYKGGIYHHTGLTGGFAPFELTNHAVLVVGYGVDQATGQFYVSLFAVLQTLSTLSTSGTLSL